METLIVVGYIIYALLQGALVNRYFVQDTTSPIGVTVISALFAPLVSIVLIVGLIGEGIMWIDRPPKKEE